MEKQKVVIKVSMKDSKSRSKALKIAVGVSGVDGAAIKGKEKDQIEVTGERVDATGLTSLLRKSFCRADLVSVGPVDAKKEEPITLPIEWSYLANLPRYPVYEIRESREPYCSIM